MYPQLSPFDEAALESALKLRDADPSVRISALVAAASAQDPLLKHVASFRLDQVSAFDSTRWPAWNSAALAAALAARVQALAAPPDLVLLGREFGDLDDGSLPPTLAHALTWTFSSLVLNLAAAADGGVLLLRQQGAVQEHRQLALPLLAAVTNHARNRLRHPLLKNVMAARKMDFALSALQEAAEAPALRLTGAAPATVAERSSACRMLGGGAAAQARELATLLLRSGEPA